MSLQTFMALVMAQTPEEKHAAENAHENASLLWPRLMPKWLHDFSVIALRWMASKSFRQRNRTEQ